MTQAEIARTWREFLNERGIMDLEERTSQSVRDLSFVYPTSTVELAKDDLKTCTVFSFEQSEGVTEGIIGAEGYVAILGSIGGSILMMNLEPSNRGNCRWISVGWDHYPEDEFCSIVTSYCGQPWEIVEKMEFLGLDYIEDDSFPFHDC